MKGEDHEHTKHIHEGAIARRAGRRTRSHHFCVANTASASHPGLRRFPFRFWLHRADFDESGVVLEAIHSDGSGETDGSYRMGLTLQLVHSFNAPGTVVLSAAHEGTLAVMPRVQYRDLKIIAIEASDISNVFLGSN